MTDPCWFCYGPTSARGHALYCESCDVEYERLDTGIVASVRLSGQMTTPLAVRYMDLSEDGDDP